MSSTPLNLAAYIEEDEPEYVGFFLKLEGIRPLLPPSNTYPILHKLQKVNSTHRRIYSKVLEQTERAQKTGILKEELPVFAAPTTKDLITITKNLLKIDLELFFTCLHQMPIDREWENQRISELEKMKESLLPAPATSPEVFDRLKILQNIYRGHLNPSLKALAVDTIRKSFLSSAVDRALTGFPTPTTHSVTATLEAFKHTAPADELTGIESVHPFAHSLRDLWQTLSPGIRLHTKSPADFAQKLERLVREKANLNS